jgi:dTDP-glucose pyrophosphorylase/CBS domain-containing protein
VKTDLVKLLIPPKASIRQAMARIDDNAQGIVLVVDPKRRLLGTITDGDVRRAILAGMDLDTSVEAVLKIRPPTPYPSPLTAPAGTPDTQLLRLMNEYAIRHVPLVDGEGRVKGVALLSDLIKEYEMPLTAVVMAGGYGTRLRPLTEHVPKPMLPVGDRPLLELIIERLRSAGVRKVMLATHYRADMIAEHFGDGRAFGVDIRYVKEDEPLGTAGALGLVDAGEEPILVINGDIVTRIDFRAMHDFHRDHQADMTVAVKQYDLQIPYGIIEIEGVNITGISEKPLLRQFINAGIYLLNPTVRRFIPKGQPYDMPDLVKRLLDAKRPVVGFPLRESWLDVGQPEDYEQAKTEAKRRSR